MGMEGVVVGGGTPHSPHVPGFPVPLHAPVLSSAAREILWAGLCFVQKSGYRAGGGEWLAAPERGLGAMRRGDWDGNWPRECRGDSGSRDASLFTSLFSTTASAPSLGFVSNSILLRALDDSLQCDSRISTIDRNSISSSGDSSIGDSSVRVRVLHGRRLSALVSSISNSSCNIGAAGIGSGIADVGGTMKGGGAAETETGTAGVAGVGGGREGVGGTGGMGGVGLMTGAVAVDSAGELHPFDLIVAADGAHSTVGALLRAHHHTLSTISTTAGTTTATSTTATTRAASTPIATDTTAAATATTATTATTALGPFSQTFPDSPLEHRGYKVFRGVCALSDLQSLLNTDDNNIDNINNNINTGGLLAAAQPHPFAHSSKNSSGGGSRNSGDSGTDSGSGNSSNSNIGSSGGGVWASFQSWGCGVRVAAVPVLLPHIAAAVGGVVGGGAGTVGTGGAVTGGATGRAAAEAVSVGAATKAGAGAAVRVGAEGVAGVSGVAWFAAISPHLLPPSNLSPHGQWIEPLRSPSNLLIDGQWSEPLSNGSRAASAAELSALDAILGGGWAGQGREVREGGQGGKGQEVQGGEGSKGGQRVQGGKGGQVKGGERWHSPIPQLLRATEMLALRDRGTWERQENLGMMGKGSGAGAGAGAGAGIGAGAGAGTGAGAEAGYGEWGVGYGAVTVCEAVASAAVNPGGSSAIYLLHLPTHPTTPTTSTTPTPCTPQYAPTPLAVAFIGDAAHTLDPILAQGAGLGVEDAWHLYAALGVLPAHIQQIQGQAQQQNNNPQQTQQTLQQQHSSVPPQYIHNAQSQHVRTVIAHSDYSQHVQYVLSPLSAALADYETRRVERVNRLHLASNFAQKLGHVDNTHLVRVRNWAISLVPHRVKGWVFDAVLRWLD
ncbi:hypothetical protein B484DRAFT_443672 [Ochromonadaceae sp. CCMP2298]|nr:hypothetical protein B484DRAFT_443672 [Ochromonadaceae sp. CCMP2298]